MTPDWTLPIREACQPFTMQLPESLRSLIEKTLRIVTGQIEGAIVECGVWKGGSMMAVAMVLNGNAVLKDLYLFDTFSGMTKPEEIDVDLNDSPAMETYRQQVAWCYAPLKEVEENMRSTGYPEKLIHYIQGDVLDTIPAQGPDQIALLRLDTDWYKSTKHELEHLFPRLSPGGVLIVDDYGHWQGSKKATDEYLAEHAPYMALEASGYSVRMGIK